MGLGTFSGNGLGFGIALSLVDKFSDPAKHVEDSLDGLEGKIEKVIQSMNQMKVGAGLMAAGAAISAGFFANISYASDLNEEMSKSGVVFGKYNTIVQDFAENTAESFGLSKRAAYGAIGTYGNLFTAMGMGQQQASEWSVSLTKLAADLASFNNTSIDEALLAIKSGMAGETEPLKRYGVALQEDILKQKALAMGLIKDTKGTLDPLVKMQAAYQVIMQQTATAQGDFLRTGDGYANMQRKIAAQWENTKASLGQIALPLVLQFSYALNKLLGIFRKFAESPIGKVVLKIVFVMGLALVVIGALTFASGALKFGMTKLAGAFGGASRAALLNTIANGGLTASFGALGTAIWTALAPLLPFIAAGLIIVGVFMFLRKAMNDFNDASLETIQNSEGMMRVFYKIGAVLSTIGEIWSSTTSEGFSMSQELVDKLKALGLYEFAVNLGTWIVRIKEFFRGVRDTFVEFKNVVVDIWNGTIKPIIKSIWESLGSVLNKFGIDIGKLGGDMSSFREAGKIVGYVILSVLIPVVISLTASMIGLAISVIAATWPILVIIGVIWAIYYAITHWGEITAWVKGKWEELKTWMSGFIDRAKNWGTDLVNKIWDGIKQKWTDLKAWFTEAWDDLVSGVKDFFGFGQDDINVNATKSNLYSYSGMQPGMVQNQTAPANAFSYNPNIQVNPGNTQVTNHLYLDSEPVANAIMSKQELESNRS